MVYLTCCFMHIYKFICILLKWLIKKKRKEICLGNLNLLMDRLRLYRQSVLSKKVNVDILWVVWFSLFLLFFCFCSWAPPDLIHLDEDFQRLSVTCYIPAKCCRYVKAEPCFKPQGMFFACIYSWYGDERLHIASVFRMKEYKNSLRREREGRTSRNICKARNYPE